jgi:protein required for attachment to host cells
LANRSIAVLYSDGPHGKFHFEQRLTDEEGSLAESELDSDRPGRGFSSATGTIRHALDHRFARHETEARRFANRVAARLGELQRSGRLAELVLVAEPHFLGLLRDSLDRATHATVTGEVPREYLQGSDAEVRALVLKALGEAG